MGEVMLPMRILNAGYWKVIKLIDKQNSPSFSPCVLRCNPEFESWNTRDMHVHTLNRRAMCNGVATGILSASRMIYCRHEQAPRNLRTPFPTSLRPSAFDVILRNVQTVARSCYIDATKGTIRLPFLASYIRSSSWFAIIIPRSW